MFIANQVPDLIEIRMVVSEMKCAAGILADVPSLCATTTQHVKTFRWFL
jgi:hypothetical protein